MPVRKRSKSQPITDKEVIKALKKLKKHQDDIGGLQSLKRLQLLRLQSLWSQGILLGVPPPSLIRPKLKRLNQKSNLVNQ